MNDENKSTEVKTSGKNKFNEHYFDVIDDEHKAYWLGFIWCDGYLCMRDRCHNGNLSYEFKLSLKESDAHHLEKFNRDLEGSYGVKFYKFHSSFGDSTEARLLICNKYFGEVLSQKYGLIPHRTDCTKIIQAVPRDLLKHFIRGILDADGAFCQYKIKESGYIVNKYSLHFGGHEEILRHTERYFIECGLVNNLTRSLRQRHEGKDGSYRALIFSGRHNVTDILNFLYKDATIYLDRKYEKYLDICNQKGGKDY